jgi:2,4'-dihydroxyacetophenone dioxygenase
VIPAKTAAVVDVARQHPMGAAGSRIGRIGVMARPNSPGTSDRLAALSPSDTGSAPTQEEPMAEAAQTEFWRDLKPIEKVFASHALPEMYTPDIATDDQRWYVPLSETVGSRPVWISVSQNSWCDVLMSTGPGLVNRHYHPHEVFAYTISGKWGYLEHDWVATAGDFVYETPGEAHTLVAYESEEPMKVHFKVKGPLIWLDENGEAVDYFDVHNYIDLCKEHYEKAGLGADYIDGLLR